MPGMFTRKMYDDCASEQDYRQSTNPLELILDINKFVNNNVGNQPSGNVPLDAADVVDVESSLRGIDKTASDCDVTKHPFCQGLGCLLTNDHRIAPHVSPYVNERGNDAGSVVTTNMQMPTDSGIRAPHQYVTSGYYRGAGDVGRPNNAPLTDIANRNPNFRDRASQIVQQITGYQATPEGAPVQYISGGLDAQTPPEQTPTPISIQDNTVDQSAYQPTAQPTAQPTVQPTAQPTVQRSVPQFTQADQTAWAQLINSVHQNGRSTNGRSTNGRSTNGHLAPGQPIQQSGNQINHMGCGYLRTKK